MSASHFDFDRLMSLSKGLIWSSDEEVCIALTSEEEQLVDALAGSRGGVVLALRKLQALTARLLAEGESDDENGRRNLRLLESASRDLSDWTK